MIINKSPCATEDTVVVAAVVIELPTVCTNAVLVGSGFHAARIPMYVPDGEDHVIEVVADEVVFEST